MSAIDVKQGNPALPAGAASLMPFAVAAGYALALSVLYFDTAAAMVRTWNESDTFAHGYLILPISLWLVWRDRATLRGLPWRPFLPAIVPLVGAAAAWLLAALVDILVLQQLAFVGMFVCGIWLMFGNALTIRLAFPLGFLFLAVPMGKGLEAPMMELTADYTVALLRLVGIPVFREGLAFSLPTGNWSVVEACSGVRYLIASFTLGLIYAYLSYSVLWRRLLFIALSVVVPIVANVIRAFGIVLLGHASNMRLATGVDHLIYGWVFFGVVMFLLFWLGTLWQERDFASDADVAGQAAAGPGTASPALQFGGAFAAVLVATLPVVVLAGTASTAPRVIAPMEAPSPPAGWQVRDADIPWLPPRRGGDRFLAARYDGAGEVFLAIDQYLTQSQGAELVAGTSPWREKDGDWRLYRRAMHPVRGLDGDKVEQVLLVSRSTGDRLLAWRWYHIDGQDTASPYIAKYLEGRQRLSGRGRGGAQLFLLTPAKEGHESEAARRLERFLISLHGEVHAALRAGLRYGE